MSGERTPHREACILGQLIKGDRIVITPNGTYAYERRGATIRDYLVNMLMCSLDQPTGLSPVRPRRRGDHHATRPRRLREGLTMAKIIEGGDNVVEMVAPVGDIFDNLELLRIKQDFNRVRVSKPFTKCLIRKPRAHEWFQTHPDEEYRFETVLFAHKEDMSAEWYLPVGADVMSELEGPSLYNVQIFLWVNRKKDAYVWPVRLADVDGKMNDWHASLLGLFTNHSIGRWVRMAAGDGGYDIEVAENDDLPGPEWPPHPMNHILRVAFKGGRVIDTLDHPVIQKLRGRVL